MKSLTDKKLTTTVLGAIEDTEVTRYRVLAILQKRRQAFESKELYPYMADLVEAYHELTEIKKQEDSITNSLKKQQEITQIDLVNEIIRHKELTTEEIRENIQNLFAITGWALPLIKDVLEAGKELYEHTSDQIEIDWVNLVSRYLDEGYLIISTPDRTSEPDHQLRAFSYTRRRISVKNDDVYHTFRLKPETLPTDSPDPEKLKEKLLARRSSHQKTFHQNPATVLATVSVPYPFKKTVFPITKRKFLGWLKQEESTDGADQQQS